ncbi:type 4 pilus major pilin, partial [Candidatus Williamhamiltonella defendens]|uniref:type 4 pilus major pilin n=1 Tax=Candidatus Williamhamiltonella defendens TaxID=138072 RepID=UPI0022862328
MKSLKKGIFNISDASIGWGMAFVGLAMVAAAGMGLYVKVYSTSAVSSINTLLNETKSLRSSTGYGTANLVPALIRSGAIPKGISIVGDTLFNASGGAIPKGISIVGDTLFNASGGAIPKGISIVGDTLFNASGGAIPKGIS